MLTDDDADVGAYVVVTQGWLRYPAWNWLRYPAWI
jgi:hypothetical protein